MAKTHAFLGALAILTCSSGFAKALAPEAVPGEYIVKLKNQASIMSTDRLGTMLGAEVVDRLSLESRAIVVRRAMVEESTFAVKALSQNSLVEYAEPNYIYRAFKTPGDAQYAKLWGMKNSGQPDPKDPNNPAKFGKAGVDINAEKAWDVTTGSENVIVGVVDTGINSAHEDLKDNMWVNEAEKKGKSGVDDDNNGFIDDIYGYDFANNKPNGIDDHGHGSHTSGTIGGRGDNGKGVAGVNWKVHLMALKFLTAEGSGSTANAIKAIDYAIKMGANVLSNSWGGGGSSQALKESIERAAAANILFVAAAGNESNNNDENPTYPVSYDVDNIVGVAALNNKGDLASFSNWGQKTVDVAAPGVSIFSSVLGASGYDIYSGTSMATPHVAGLAALVLSASPGLTYQDLKARLTSTVTKMSNMKSRVSSSGLINAYNAVTGTVPPPDPNDPENWQQEVVNVQTPHPYNNKMNETYEVRIPGAKKVAVFFNRFEIEREYAGVTYDKVEFFDGTGKSLGVWTGYHNAEYSPVADGEVITFKFTSDDSFTLHGFEATKAGVIY